MVTESVSIISEDPVSRSHHDRGHSIRFHLHHRAFIPTFRDRHDLAEPALVRQDAISPPNAAYLDWSPVGCDEGPRVEAQSRRCHESSEPSLAELLLNDASLTIRQSGVVEGCARFDTFA